MRIGKNALMGATAAVALAAPALTAPAAAQADPAEGVAATDSRAAELERLVARCRQRGASGIDPAAERERYARLYRELRANRDALQEAAATEENEAARGEYALQYRRLDAFLAELPHPSEFECSAPLSNADRGPPGGGRDQRGDARTGPGYNEFFGSFDVDRTRVPVTGIGFRREGAPGTAPETFAGTTPENVTRFGGELGFRTGGFGASIGYREGDGETSFSIPGGAGVDSGIVYGDLSPGGSSGIATPFGLDGETQVDWEEWFLRIEAEVKQMGSYEIMMRAYGYGSYTHSDRDYSGRASGSGSQGGFTFELMQVRDQSVDDEQFEIGMGVEGRTRWDSAVQLTFGAEAGAYYHDSSLRSVETNSNNFTGPPDGAFTVEIDDSRDGIGFHGRASAGLEVSIAHDVWFGLFASAEYRSDIGAVFNPNSGDQVFFDGRTTELRSEDVWSWGGGARLSVGF